MYDQQLFLQTLSRFAVVLPARYDLETALIELTKSIIAVLGVTGSGVTIAGDGKLQFVTAVSHASGELERNQEEFQAGPCRDAYDTGEVVRVTDVFGAMDDTDRRRCRERLPELPGPALVTRLELQVAARHVQAHGVAVDVVERVSDVDVDATMADRHHQFDLVVDVLGADRVVDGRRSRPPNWPPS